MFTGLLCTLCNALFIILTCLCITGLSKAEIQAAVLESERRLAEKHARLEGAVVQVLLQLLYNPHTLYTIGSSLVALADLHVTW